MITTNFAVSATSNKQINAKAGTIVRKWLSMPHLAVFVILSFSCVSVFASAVKIVSNHNVEETVDLYEQALKSAKIPVLSKSKFEQNLPSGISQQGEELKFSNPFYGWNLGECHRGLRKDKPMTTRVYKDTSGLVWLEYTQPDESINSFGVIECGNETDKVRRALGAFASSATD